MRWLVKQWWFYLVSVFVIVHLLGLTKQIIVLLDDREINRQTADWFDRAKHEISAELKPLRAAEWFRRNGFSPVVNSLTHRTDESVGKPKVEEDYFEVIAVRQLSAGGLFTKPAWLEVHFQFTPAEKKFLRVDHRMERNSRMLLADRLKPDGGLGVPAHAQ